MKKLLIASLAIAAALPAMAKGTTWNIQGTNYHVDTTYHAVIGPGTTRTSVVLSEGIRPLRVFYTTTDLSNPYADVRAVSGKGLTTGLEVMSKQAKRNDKAGARYFAGVNANFFSNQAPRGNCIADGEIFRGAAVAKFISFYMDSKKNPGLYAGFTGTALFPDETILKLNGINAEVGTNNLVLFDKCTGTKTGTNEYCGECVVEFAEGSLNFSGRSTLRVVSEPQSTGNSTIPTNGYVLCGHGTAKDQILKLKVGDLISLNLNSSISDIDITQMVDGNCQLVKDGVVLNTANYDNMSSQLHPRTMIGYGDGGKTVVMMIVDGRSGISGGCTYPELGDLMKIVGCTDAINLDGGGSSELYTTAHGYVNDPSDGYERSVTNSIWNVSTAPDDTEIASIAFEKQSIHLPRYGFYRPVIYGYNQYGVLVDTDVKNYTLSAPEALGEVRNEGTTLFVKGSGGLQALTATLPNGISATCAVSIGEGVPRLRLSDVLVDSYRDYTVEVLIDIDGLEMPVDNIALEWQSEDTSIATVDENGVVHGVANGKTNIIGILGGTTLTLPVNVVIPPTHYLPAVNKANVDAWTTSVNNVKVNSVTAGEGSASAFNVNYTVTLARVPSVTVRFNATLDAFPDSLRLVVNPGSAKISKVRLSLATKDGTVSHVEVGAPTVDKDNVYLFAVKDFFDVEEIANYPAVLTQLTFNTGSAAKTTGDFQVKSLETVYNVVSADAGVSDIIADDPESNGPVYYYNLQGQSVRPATAGPGVYIRRQGNKATKIAIK